MAAPSCESYRRPIGRTRPRQADAPILLAAAPAGSGWVQATVARRTYGRRLCFARYDLALSAEGSVLLLASGWRFVGLGRRAPLVEVIEEGWLPRPAALHRQSR